MVRQAKLDVPGTLRHVMMRGILKRQIVDALTIGNLIFKLCLQERTPELLKEGD